MRGLDLFAGIGLFGEGMSRAGVDVVGFCELADWKCMIHRELHGALPEWRDIRDMRGKDVLRRAGPIDIVFGSPPCTDASLANSNGKGISGSETGLFVEAIRIVREIRPDWVALGAWTPPHGTGQNLIGYLASLPTPRARDWRSGKASQATMDRNSRPLNETLAQRSMTGPAVLAAIYAWLMAAPPRLLECSCLPVATALWSRRRKR